MKRSRFTQEQITFALRLADSGTPVVDVCRQIGGGGRNKMMTCQSFRVQGITCWR